MFTCAPISSNKEIRITKPKLVERSAVNFAVCVKNPGPIAEVAIKNAAPSIAEFFFIKQQFKNAFYNTGISFLWRHRCVAITSSVFLVAASAFNCINCKYYRKVSKSVERALLI